MYLGSAFLAFQHQKELPPPKGIRGHLSLCKLQFAVLPLECREPEGAQGSGIVGAQQTCLWAPFVSAALHPRDGGTSLGVRRTW